jgi:Tol biopolymer transport system component
MFVRAADGSGPTERLVTSDKVQRPSSWSPDGRMLSFTQDDPMPDLWTLSFAQPPTTRPMVQLPGYQMTSRISPDGRWLAYASEESGQFEVYVASFPDGARKWPVSSGGGQLPVWAESGRELFYVNGDDLMVVDVDTRAAFRAGKPTRLFQMRSPARTSAYSYDVSPDGQRFVMIQSAEDVGARQINVVLGWSDELTRRARAGQR